MKSYLKNKRFIHVSKPPLIAIALLGDEKAKELYNATGTYRRSNEVPAVLNVLPEVENATIQTTPVDLS